MDKSLFFFRIKSIGFISNFGLITLFSEEIKHKAFYFDF